MKKQIGLPAQAVKVILILLLISAGFFYWHNIYAEEKININTATDEELDTLPGIGPSKAQAIIDYREEHGPFQAIEDIINVSGIGSATFEKIKDCITVGDSLELNELFCGNGNMDKGEECDDGNNVNNDECSDDCLGEQDTSAIINNNEDEIGLRDHITSPQDDKQYNLGDVVINEFVSDPTDGEVEWIELYSTTGKKINLDGWNIEEGSGARTKLEGMFSGSGDEKFFIIEKPKGNLNNKGDIIILRDGEGNLIDQVVYGNWDGGNINNNALAANDPYSVARKFDGCNSFNNFNDFAITATPTKGASNIIMSLENKGDDEISAEERANYDYSNDIIISEIFPNPTGSDRKDEFIELYNKGTRDVDLLGWRLGDNSKKKHWFKTDSADSVESFGVDASRDNSVIIKAGDYLAIYRSESKIALNNGGDNVKLYQPLKDEPLQVIKYKKAVEGQSLNILDLRLPVYNSMNDNYTWSEATTPGKANIIKTINHPPTADFSCLEDILVGVPVIFDSSDTIDEDGDKLKFSWDFGDGFTNILASPEHTFFKQGVYMVKLIVSDGENEVEKEKIVQVVAARAPNSSSAHSLLDVGAKEQTEVIINEFLPNSEEADIEKEFIELYNQGSNSINLMNWKIDDSEGGSKPYSFDFDLWLSGGTFYVLERAESGLALNNINDAVRLFNDLDELVEEIKYENAIKGESYARGRNGKWFWTTVLTPGKENIISVADSKKLEIRDQKSERRRSQKKNSKKIIQVIKTTLEKIKEFELGDFVKVGGIVAVKPGVLGSQYFYIVGSPGIQVYNYKKEFPDLRVGDYIEVTGELSVNRGEDRLKTKQINDIKIIEHRKPPIASELTCEKINKDYVGRLIQITGEVVERKSSIIYLDDGTDEVVVYIKKATGINPRSIKEGEIITVIGLVGTTNSGVRIMPRSNDDIIKKDIESNSSLLPRVLGEVAASNEWEIAQRDKKLELFKYLLVIAGGLIIVLTGLLMKMSG